MNIDRLLANRWHLPITNRDEARDFLQNLVAKGLDYHPDDDAADIVSDGKPLFTEHEAPYINARMAEAKKQLSDDDLYEIIMPYTVERLADELANVQDKMEDLLKEQAKLLAKLAKLA